MKPIKVYLQYPWKFPDSPYYKYLVENPPNNIKYLNGKKQKGAITSKKKILFLNKLKAVIRSTLTILNMPVPNIPYLRYNKNFDLIHCAHCLASKKMPWVADFESVYQLWISSRITKHGIKIAKKILLNKSCKKIMPWSEDTKKDLLKLFPEIKNKVEVVYPAVPLQKMNKKNTGGKLTIIYVSRYFWVKGGLVALETLDRLKKKYNLNVIFISEVPENIKKKYKNIKIIKLIPQKKLFNYLKKADLFFYPSFLDGFGFSLLEAMSFGLPIITIETDGTRSCKEIVQDGKTGFIVDFPHYKGNILYSKVYGIGKNEEELIKNLVKKTSLLIENQKLRKRMSKNCINVIKNGKFSIKERNKKLKKIYEEAIK